MKYSAIANRFIKEDTKLSSPAQIVEYLNKNMRNDLPDNEHIITGYDQVYRCTKRLINKVDRPYTTEELDGIIKSNETPLTGIIPEIVVNYSIDGYDNSIYLYSVGLKEKS